MKQIPRFFLNGEEHSFLPSDRQYTLQRSYFVSPLFCIFSFVERNSWITLSVVVPICGQHTQVAAVAPLSVLLRVLSFCSLCCGYCFFHHRITSPFSDTPLTILATALPSSQCPCRMIWFEEILKGSYKVVLCPRSGEGYFGLARRTYSLQCPPDIAAVRLNRFTFRQCDEAIPTRGCWALRRCSTKRSMALPQLPAHVVHKLGQQRVIQEFLSTREYAKESRWHQRLSLFITLYPQCHHLSGQRCFAESE